MGCVVNGPGESKHADIGISLPGHVRGARSRRSSSTAGWTGPCAASGIVPEFLAILDGYVDRRYGSVAADADRAAGPPLRPDRGESRRLLPLSVHPSACILRAN